MKQKIMLSMLIVFSLLIGNALAAITNTNPTGNAVLVSMLNQDPDPAIAGEIVEIRIGVQNLGDASTKNYFLELTPEYPFDAVPGEELVSNLGILSPTLTGDNMKIVKFKVKIDKDATAGSYDLPVLSYEQGTRDINVKNLFSIDVESKDSAEIIYIDQVELVPGQITPLKFTINNVGSTPLRDLSFQWENENDIVLPVGSDNTKYIKYIDVGNSAVVKFDVIASTLADPNLYKLDLKLTYKDPVLGTDKVISTKAGVYVGGATDFDVAFSGISNGDSSFSIANIGSVSASSVTVNIPQQPGWRVSGSNSVIIGNLNKGDYTIASFKLSSASQTAQIDNTQTRDINSFQRNATQRNSTFRNNAQSSNVQINIVYTDSRGNRKTITKEVSLDSSSFQTNSTTLAGGNSGFGRRAQSNPLQNVWNSLPLIIAVLVLLFAAIVIQRKYKKGKLKDPDYTYGNAIKDIIKRKKK